MYVITTDTGAAVKPSVFNQELTVTQVTDLRDLALGGLYDFTSFVESLHKLVVGM